MSLSDGTALRQCSRNARSAPRPRRLAPANITTAKQQIDSSIDRESARIIGGFACQLAEQPTKRETGVEQFHICTPSRPRAHRRGAQVLCLCLCYLPARRRWKISRRRRRRGAGTADRQEKEYGALLVWRASKHLAEFSARLLCEGSEGRTLCRPLLSQTLEPEAANVCYVRWYLINQITRLPWYARRRQSDEE